MSIDELRDRLSCSKALLREYTASHRQLVADCRVAELRDRLRIFELAQALL